MGGAMCKSSKNRSSRSNKTDHQMHDHITSDDNSKSKNKTKRNSVECIKRIHKNELKSDIINEKNNVKHESEKKQFLHNNPKVNDFEYNSKNQANENLEDEDFKITYIN